MGASAFPGAIEFEARRIPLQTLNEPLATTRGVTLSVARLDLVDPVISGNKWYKLLPNLQRARKQGYRRVLSFGGPWSNHIHALAWAGKRFGIETVGVIRGYASLALTATLRDARDWGMQLHFLDHSEYALKQQKPSLDALQRRFGSCYIVPEGGCNATGIAGCRRALSTIDGDIGDFTSAVLAVGTGATLAGLIAEPSGLRSLLGVSVLKGDQHAEQRIAQLLSDVRPVDGIRWEIETGCHFGGYARTRPRLTQFIENFHHRHGIALEPVYTGKMMFALYQRLEAGWFAPGEKVLALHTGGMQGLRGFADNWPWAAAIVAGRSDCHAG